MKVRTRVILVFLFLVSLAFFYLWHRLDRSVRPVYLESLEDDLVEMAMVLSTAIARDSSSVSLNLDNFSSLIDATKSRPMRAVIYDRLKDAVDLRVYVTDHRGIVIYDSEYPHRVGQDFSSWNDVHRTLSGNYGARATWEETPAGRILILHAAAPILVQGRLLGVVTAAKPTAAAYPYFLQARREVFIGLIVTVGVVLIWRLRLTRWVDQPIRKLIEFARAVRDGERVTPPKLGQSEIGQMANAFDEMRRSLEGKSYIEAYVQTLTHEIKSPLSGIRGAAELIDDHMPPERRQSFLNNIMVETHRIQRIVEKLLELSSIESRDGLRDTSRVDLAELAAEIIALAEPVITARELQIRLHREGALIVDGEPFLLRLAISNLMQNAFDFTPPKGTIDIHFGRRSLQIRDSGPGIPNYALTRIFNRFYSLRRPDSGRKSSGLGLAIVRQVSELHQGGIEMRNRDGGGAEAILWFPMSAVLSRHETID